MSKRLIATFGANFAGDEGMTESTLDLAMQLHQTGRAAEAEKLYRQILAENPDDADALHLLGVLEFQTGRHSAAVEHISRAVQIDPEVAEFQYNLALAVDGSGDIDRAIQILERCLQLRPDFFQAENALAIALAKKGRMPEAIAVLRRAVEIKPDFPEAWNNLGNALWSARKLDEAESALNRALALRTDYAEAYNNLGIVLEAKGSLDASIDALRKAIELKPNYPEAFSNLAKSLQLRGDWEESITAARHALALRRNFAPALNNLGYTFAAQGKWDEAIESYREAIASQPDFAEAHSNLASALAESGRQDEAVDSARAALQIRPDFPEAYVHLANALRSAGQVAEAIEQYKKAADLRDDYPLAQSSRLYTLYFSPEYDSDRLLNEHRQWGEKHARPLSQRIQPHRNIPDPDRPLRIGYVSPDFKRQAESFFTAPLFSAHDPKNFPIYLYSGVARPDGITRHMRQFADVWRDIVSLSDESLAELIRSDEIDILVDLTMHMAGNRLLTFARKPAPIQVTWLAYPGTTGVEAIDYRLTDSWMDSPGDDKFYVEQSMRLPDCWVCFDPLSEEPVAPRRAGGPVTFASLNNPCKLNEPTIDLWGRVLAATGDSRLIVQSFAQSQREKILAWLARSGIAPNRVEFVGRMTRRDYLRSFDRIDIALDPLPYNGITTTLDGLWMGTPTVTLAGKTASGRAGLGILSTLGMPELAAHTPEQFVQIAADLAGDSIRLAELRATLRSGLAQSALMDSNRFARNVEEAYRGIWRKWCAR
jgi:protein O-GlcNAc transferase